MCGEVTKKIPLTFTNYGDRTMSVTKIFMWIKQIFGQTKVI